MGTPRDSIHCGSPAGVRLAGLALIVGVLLSASGVGQTPEEHASHHPPANADNVQAPSEQPGMTQEGPPGAMGSAETGHMGSTARKELYPSLIELTQLTPAKRTELQRLARERMTSGTALMSSGLEQLNAYTAANDLASMQLAAARMRQGALQVESGIAALRSLSDGRAPRSIALDWFKRTMNLPAEDVQVPHGLFGLSGFHYFTMILLFASAATLVWTNVRKMKRAQALVARLADTEPSIPLTERQEIPAVQIPPQSTPVAPTEAPSKPNAWTGLLRVVRIFEETPNVRTLRLANPSGGDIPFRHLPGQFLTFTVAPIDQSIKRSYTIASSSTRREYLEVTVKREERGTVSSFLHSVHEGDTLQVTGPSGNFTFLGEGANSIVLISGGVGITPMMSVLRYLTDRSWSGEIFFIYGCNTEQQVIYRQELEYLQRRYPNLTLVIAANEIASTGWPYAQGFITKELLTKAVPHIQTRRVHLCGPPPMMAAVKSVLTELGVPAEQVKTEIFIGRERPVTPRADTEAAPRVPATQPVGEPANKGVIPGVAVATFARSRRTALLPPSKTVLEASEEVGVNIDYSCRVGVCGVCKVKLLSGAVTMEVQEGLDAKDKQNNVILACQAKASADISVDA